MTAFARRQTDLDQCALSWEIRSVNHRYLELFFRLPEGFRQLEPRLRESVRSLVRRGKLDASLQCKPHPAADASISVDTERLGHLRKALKQVQGPPGLTWRRAVNPLELLQWPGVIREQGLDSQAIAAEAMTLFQSALEELVEHRRREGEELGRQIAERLAGISGIVQSIRAALPQILEAQTNKIREQFTELKMAVEPTRLEQEMALLMQKSDIHEEIDRLDAHVRETERTLSQAEPIGRRLDFLMQELNREANTICSKAAVTETSLQAVELKVLIEQMREQVQNIE